MGIAELRQYMLHPGRRAALVELFERHFVTGQEDAGMTLGGIFLDEDDPDRFVWMRGFPSLEARQASLEAFYGGPVWKEHRDAANATMIDSDDVLMLRPVRPAVFPGAFVHIAVYGSTPVNPPGAVWETSPLPNTFPALPVRTDHAVVCATGYPDEPSRDAAIARLDPSVPRQDLRLRPTSLSRHHSQTLS